MKYYIHFGQLKSPKSLIFNFENYPAKRLPFFSPCLPKIYHTCPKHSFNLYQSALDLYSMKANNKPDNKNIA
jgi:hypothetical protein